MDLQAAITIFLAVLALAMKPGPGMMAIMSRTMSLGMKGCFAHMTAVCLVSLVYLGLVMGGLKFAHDDLLFVSIILKTAAAAYLIYLGIKGLQHLDVDLTLREHKAESLFEAFTSALLLTIANPFIILFYGALLPTVIDISAIEASAFFTIGAIICAVETGVAVAYCIPVAYSRYVLTGPLLRKINLVASIVMILVGLYIGYSAMPASDVLAVVGQQ